MGIVDIIPWKQKTVREVEKDFCQKLRFPFQKSWLSLPSVLGGTNFREPECEVVESPAEYVITARLPGVSSKEIKLTFRRRTLKLRAEHRAEEDCLRQGVVGWHRSARSYFKALRLPTKVHAEAAKVDFRKGVLKVRLPKCQAPQLPSWLTE